MVVCRLPLHLVIELLDLTFLNARRRLVSCALRVDDGLGLFLNLSLIPLLVNLVRFLGVLSDVEEEGCHLCPGRPRCNWHRRRQRWVEGQC